MLRLRHAASSSPEEAVRMLSNSVSERALATFHRHFLCGAHANRAGSSGRKVQAHAFCEWSTIIHPHNGGFSGLRISNHKTGAEGQRPVGRSEPLWIENFPRCGTASSKFVTVPSSCHEHRALGGEKRATRLSTALLLLKGMGGHHAPSKETLEAEASGMRGTVVGGRRVVVVAGERSIRDTRWPRSGHADAEHRSESRRHHSR